MADENPPLSSLFSSDEISSGKTKTILTSRVTWGAAFACVIAIIILPNIGGLLLVAAIVLGMNYYWEKCFPAVEEKVAKQLIAKSYSEENFFLERSIKQLQEGEGNEYAQQLFELTEQKKTIQESIYSLPPNTQKGQNITHPINTFCNEISHVLSKMAEIRYTLNHKKERFTPQQRQFVESSQKELGECVTKAAEALAQVRDQLILTRNQTRPTEEENLSLAHSLEQLNKERIYAYRIRFNIDRIFGHKLANPAFDQAESITIETEEQAKSAIPEQVEDSSAPSKNQFPVRIKSSKKIAKITTSATINTFPKATLPPIKTAQSNRLPRRRGRLS